MKAVIRALPVISPTSMLLAMLIVSLVVTFGTAYFGITFALLVLLLILGVPFLLGIILYPKFGVIVLLIVSYLIMWVTRFGLTGDFPLGTLMDGFYVLLIIGLLATQKIERNWDIFKNPITYMIGIWIGYNILEVANPVAESRLAWLYSIRSTAIVMVTYFVFLKHIRSVKFLRLIFKLWIGLTLFAALYAIKQEFFGFFAFEEKDIQSAQARNLLFIGGHWRKWSIFSDPVAFSYNMVVSAILCIVLIMNEIKFYKKLILGFLAFLFMATMLYSGTRGANVLLPASIFMLAVMKFNYRILTFSLIGVAFLVVLIFIPTSNQNIVRFQSAFKPSDDPSFNLRKANQKRIQPYIQTHPFGGGLGSTEVWGTKFAPNSYLAHFPPDSGYVRVAVELGYVGLFLLCTFMFTIFKTGIRNYYAIKDPELKNYCLAMVLIVFALNIGNYPQESLIQFPLSVYFYLCIAIMQVTRRLDDEKQQLSLT